MEKKIQKVYVYASSNLSQHETPEDVIIAFQDNDSHQPAISTAVSVSDDKFLEKIDELEVYLFDDLKPNNHIGLVNNEKTHKLKVFVKDSSSSQNPYIYKYSETLD